MIQIDVIKPEHWQRMSEKAHLVCFDKHKPKEMDRIDFALLAVKDGEDLLGYLTCREMDSETLYWQFGGAFPGTKSTSVSFSVYKLFVVYSKQNYKRVTTLIENDNTVMLKMAMKVGFKIVGLRNYKGLILLEHLLEFDT